jgi:hypothetical protein
MSIPKSKFMVSRKKYTSWGETKIVQAKSSWSGKWCFFPFRKGE